MFLNALMTGKEEYIGDRTGFGQIGCLNVILSDTFDLEVIVISSTIEIRFIDGANHLFEEDPLCADQLIENDCLKPLWETSAILPLNGS